jgi:hypothetical protein
LAWALQQKSARMLPEGQHGELVGPILGLRQQQERAFCLRRNRKC